MFISNKTKRGGTEPHLDTCKKVLVKHAILPKVEFWKKFKSSWKILGIIKNKIRILKNVNEYLQE